MFYSKGRSHLQDLSFITKGFKQAMLLSSDIAKIQTICQFSKHFRISVPKTKKRQKVKVYMD